jgi:hypothetical protein
MPEEMVPKQTIFCDDFITKEAVVELKKRAYKKRYQDSSGEKEELWPFIFKVHSREALWRHIITWNYSVLGSSLFDFAKKGTYTEDELYAVKLEFSDKVPPNEIQAISKDGELLFRVVSGLF